MLSRSDFVYMVPPFLAYYGLIAQNESLVVEAYNQIKLYRSYLRNPSANNLWRHILLGSDAGAPLNDEGYWATGAPHHIEGRHDEWKLMINKSYR